MSIIPMDAGQKAILPDGVQVNTISENTVGNGVQIQGRTNGVTIGAGLVGEKIQLASVPADYTSVTLSEADVTGCSFIIPTTGIWMIALSVGVSVGTTSPSPQANQVVVKVTDGSNVQLGRLKTSTYLHSATVSYDVTFMQSISDIVSITGTTTVKLRVYKTAADYGAVNFNSGYSFYAVRIA